jgi:N-hydroxyarylamine O-acetyltransferase
MLTESGRVTLSGRTLIRTVNGERDERELGDDADVLGAYRTWFGIELDRVPEIRPPAAKAGHAQGAAAASTVAALGQKP